MSKDKQPPATNHRLIDTHCHIHDDSYDFVIKRVLEESEQAGVVGMVCVGTNVITSRQAVDLARREKACYPSIGIHPHSAEKHTLADLKLQIEQIKRLGEQFRSQIIAVGECGLDYYYRNTPMICKRQKLLLEMQFELASDLDLPIIFHIREAFDDFWPIYESFGQPIGVVHSFSDQPSVIEAINNKYPNLYVGLNGIMTFTKDQGQLQAAKMIDNHRLLLETDSPYLTPPPLRGKMNQPSNLALILDFLAKLRSQSPQFLANRTTANARKLFKI